MSQPKKVQAIGCDIPCDQPCCEEHAKYEQQRSRGGGYPLCMSRVGDQVEVSQVMGGNGCAGKLTEMGILPGQTVKVLGNLGGPMIIEVKGSRLSLGRGLAMKIMVK